MPFKPPDNSECEPLAHSPDAQSTPFPVSASHSQHSDGATAASKSGHSATSPSRSAPEVPLTGASPEVSTCSSADIYKMRAHGNRGDRSPTRIEFNRVQRIRNPRGCFIFRKSEAIRYKFAGASVPADRTKTDLKTQLPKARKHDNTTKPTKEIPAPSVKPASQPPIANKLAKATTAQSAERVDVYHFDHGSRHQFRTTDCAPQLHTDRLARETSDTATRFWAELYGSLHIVVAVLVAFILQTWRFLMYSIVRPLLVGGIQIVGDYLLKPLLTACFNGIVQPPLVFGVNILRSVEQLTQPLATMSTRLLEPLVAIIGALRLVEVTHYHGHFRETDTADSNVENEKVHFLRPEDGQYDVEDV